MMILTSMVFKYRVMTRVNIGSAAEHSESIFSQWPIHDIAKVCIGKRSIQSTRQINGF